MLLNNQNVKRMAGKHRFHLVQYMHAKTSKAANILLNSRLSDICETFTPWMQVLIFDFDHICHFNHWKSNDRNRVKWFLPVENG